MLLVLLCIKSYLQYSSRSETGGCFSRAWEFFTWKHICDSTAEAASDV